MVVKRVDHVSSGIVEGFCRNDHPPPKRSVWIRSEKKNGTKHGPKPPQQPWHQDDTAAVTWISSAWILQGVPGLSAVHRICKEQCAEAELLTGPQGPWLMLQLVVP